MAAPTEPMMNSGPELLENAISRSASVFERLPALYRSAAVAAPRGKPEISPAAKAAAPAGATLKSGSMMGDAARASTDPKPEYIRSPDMTKNGNSVGMMYSKHISSASREYFITAPEFMSMNMIAANTAA